MKKKQNYKLSHPLVINLREDIILASDHKNLIVWNQNEVYIVDIKSNSVIYRSKVLGPINLNLTLNSLHMDQFCQKLFFVFERNNNLNIGYLSLKYLKIFKTKEMSTQTTNKRYFDFEEISLYKTTTKRIKHTQSELNQHLKTVFRNLGYNQENCTESRPSNARTEEPRVQRQTGPK